MSIVNTYDSSRNDNNGCHLSDFFPLINVKNEDLIVLFESKDKIFGFNFILKYRKEYICMSYAI